MAHFPANSNGMVELTTNRSFLTSCHTTTKKQQNMHDVISNKLESFYNLLQTTKESLSDDSKRISELIVEVGKKKLTRNSNKTCLSFINQMPFLISRKWAKANREGLMKMQSSLEFSLHKMKFIQILLFKTPLEAIQYGRQHFGAFSEKRYNGNIELFYTCILSNIPLQKLKD
ncbi:hypothetical protein RO3G_13389 [Rhizopus delemar RA 99-880]|uniref:CTLH domain-containing protein n=1 Tax=Rhizopus delemar (strain RA 99-880 / ATCC MYA-4621 / FGSC 9543 / NRRL 43880) TaxID=246409 RepID=I1CJP8_RHIO9|nr:hypothetical protein RO3G_13389 [Rhizopus delemar RA 99-880]|eukprot:EIE88678.1 hypothetical protein RO3G_13389 [Rhizopus delemar RA 99-880]